MANGFVTFLDHAGADILTFLKKDVEPVLEGGVVVAKAAEPFVDVAFPGIAPLFNATVAAVGQAQAAGLAASATGGNGPQKLSAVLAAIEPLAIAYLQQQGVTVNQAQITAWINAIVAALNAIPAPSTAK